MGWEGAPTGKRGRRQLYSDAATQSCLTLEGVFDVALRQATGFVESLLRLIGLEWSVPGFSTLRRRQKTLTVNIPHRGSNGPLHLLIDRSRIRIEAEGEWNARKHGGLKRRVWRKIHLGIDEQTLEVRAVEVTASDIGDAPMLPELLGQIAPHHEVASVTADGSGACPRAGRRPDPGDTRTCHDAIAARGAAAVIPPRRNAQPWKETTAGAAARNEALRASRRLGRAVWPHGAAIIAAAARRRRCTASSSSVSASWRATSTGRSQSSMSGSPC
jgi:hypothetical protein